MTRQASRLYLVDVSSYIFRAFHAIPLLSTKDGLPTNAILGVVNMLLKLVNEEHPERIGIVFDAGGPTFRDEIDVAYKANRSPTPDALVPQLPYVRRVVEAFRLRCVEVPGVEADDVIATLARNFACESTEVVVVTGDKDLMQLVGPHVSLYMPSGGRGGTLEPRRVRRAEVEARFGVPPEKVVEVMGLTGDPVDNIPGVKGIGGKIARALIQKFGSVDELLSRLDEVEAVGLRGAKRIHDLLAGQAESARQSRELALLKSDVAIEVTLDDFRMQAPDYPKLRRLFTELGFQSKIPLVAPRERSKSGTTGWIETRADLDLFTETLIGRDRVAIEFVEGEGESQDCLVVAPEQGEAFVVGFGGEIRLRDLAPFLAAATPTKVGADLQRILVRLEREGVPLAGLDFDVGVASFVVNPSRQSHRVEDLALEHLGRSLVTGLEESEHAVGEAAAERTRSMVCLEAPLREQLAEQRAETLFREIEMPLVSVLARVEARGARVDTDGLAALGSELGERLRVLLGEIHELAGREFDVGSSSQLRETLFSRLKLSANGPQRGNREWTTDMDVLGWLAREHPLARRILDYRSLAKLKSNCVDALPALVDPETGRVHCRFDRTGAASGRLSSRDPDLRDIPTGTEEGRRVRAAFLPARGRLLISADYSQIELRVLAHIADDPALISAFREREDIHTRTAAELFQVDAGAVSADQRRAAKVINFGIVRGTGALGLSRELEISLEQAEGYIDRYFRRHPGVSRYVRATLEEARAKGYVSTLAGRRWPVPDLTSQQGAVRQFGERKAVSVPIEGTAADLIKAAMVRIDRRLRERRSDAGIILQIHDELVLEVPEAEADEIVGLVREEMEGSVRLSVPLEVAIGVGSSWAKIH